MTTSRPPAGRLSGRTSSASSPSMVETSAAPPMPWGLTSPLFIASSMKAHRNDPYLQQPPHAIAAPRRLHQPKLICHVSLILAAGLFDLVRSSVGHALGESNAVVSPARPTT